MDNFTSKEKNLDKLIDKLSNLSSSYSQSDYDIEKIKTEKNQLQREKKEIEIKYDDLLKEHKYIKNKILKLQEEMKKKQIQQEEFDHEINQLNKETEELVEEIEKWQM